jgi:hypothetical protein
MEADDRQTLSSSMLFVCQHLRIENLTKISVTLRQNGVINEADEESIKVK